MIHLPTAGNIDLITQVMISYRYLKGSSLSEAIIIADPKSPGRWIAIDTYALEDVWRQGWENAIQTAKVDPVEDEDDLITASRRFTEAIEIALTDMAMGFALSKRQMSEAAGRHDDGLREKLQNLQNFQSSQSTDEPEDLAPLTDPGGDETPLDG